MTEHPSIIDAAEERRLYEASLAGRDEPIRAPRRSRGEPCRRCGGVMVRCHGEPVYCLRCGWGPTGWVA